MKGEYMDVDTPGGAKQKTFEAAQCARTLKLTATHKPDGAIEEKASKLFKNEVSLPLSTDSIPDNSFAPPKVPHGDNPISVVSGAI
jgi:hypothetical protein